MSQSITKGMWGVVFAVLSAALIYGGQWIVGTVNMHAGILSKHTSELDHIEKQLGFVRDDLKEIKSDVKEALKNSNKRN